MQKKFWMVGIGLGKYKPGWVRLPLSAPKRLLMVNLVIQLPKKRLEKDAIIRGWQNVSNQFFIPIALTNQYVPVAQ